MSTVSVGPIYFAAGHRILGLAGPGAKCRNLHGHTFGATWTYAQDDSLEFGQMKYLLKGLVKCHFDHLFFVDQSDDLLNYLAVNQLRHVATDGPPTTERIAALLAKRSEEIFTLPVDEWNFKPNPKIEPDQKGHFPDSTLLSVRLSEGPENTATWQNPTFFNYTPPAYKPGGLVVDHLTGLRPLPNVYGTTFGVANT